MIQQQPNQLDSLIASVSKQAAPNSKLDIIIGIRLNKELDEIFRESRQILNITQALNDKPQLDKATFMRLCAYIGVRFVTVMINDMTDKRKEAATSEH